MLLLGLSGGLFKTLIHYNLSANAIASMNEYFNAVFI